MLALVRDVVSSGNVPAAARSRSSWRATCFRRHRLRPDVGAQGQGGAGRHPDREAVHASPRSSPSTATRSTSATAPTASRPPRSSTSGKSSKDLNPRGGGDDRGHHPGQRPRQSPYVNPDAAMRRRNYALDRMATEGFITPQEAAEAKASRSSWPASPTPPAALRRTSSRRCASTSKPSTAPRPLRERPHGPHDPRPRAAARPPTARSIAACGGSTSAAARSASPSATCSPRSTRSRASGTTAGAGQWPRRHRPRRGHRRGRRRAGASVRIGALTAELNRAAVQWTRRTSAADLVKAGDLVEVELATLDEGGPRPRSRSNRRRSSKARWSPSTTARARVLAMVGGYSFARSKFNRATQAFRQMGSTFKPFLYTAAIDRGLTPTTMLEDVPADLRRRRRASRRMRRATTTASSGPDDAAPRSRAVAQHPGREGHGHARDRRRSWPMRRGSVSRQPFRPSSRRRSARGGHAHRADERVLGVPEPRHPHGSLTRSSPSPIASGTCSRRTARRRGTRSGPTRRT
jgi:hypothetical protein